MIAATSPDGVLDWWSVPAAGGAPQQMGAKDVFEKAGLLFIVALEAATWDGAGPIVSSQGDLWRVPVSTTTWKVSRPPERLTFGSGIEAGIGASGSGRIAFTSIQERQNIWSLAIDTATGGGLGEFVQLTGSDASDVSCDYALDADRMVYISNRWGNTDIWTRDFRSGKEANLTNDAAHQQQPIISRDGSQVAYLTQEEDKPAIYVRPFDGGVGGRVCSDCGGPRAWSPDKKFILYQRADSGATHRLNVENGETTEILKAAEGKIVSARFSPDGRWIAFRRELADRKGALLAAPFRGVQAVPESSWVEIAPANHVNDKPRWGPNGNILYFLSNRERNTGIWMRRLDPATKKPLGEPESLRQFPFIRQSLETMDFVSMELAVGRNRLVLPVGELTGSIWLMEPKAAASDSTGPRP
jgi:Tol biopolymer transport system component